MEPDRQTSTPEQRDCCDSGTQQTRAIDPRLALQEPCARGFRATRGRLAAVALGARPCSRRRCSRRPFLSEPSPAVPRRPCSTDWRPSGRGSRWRALRSGGRSRQQGPSDRRAWSGGTTARGGRTCGTRAARISTSFVFPAVGVAGLIRSPRSTAGSTRPLTLCGMVRTSTSQPTKACATCSRQWVGQRVISSDSRTATASIGTHSTTAFQR